MLVYIIHNQQNNQIILTYETLIEHSPKLQYTHSSYSVEHLTRVSEDIQKLYFSNSFYILRMQNTCNQLPAS